MLADPLLLEVWCENLDDITLIGRAGDVEELEFVQVEKNEPDQLRSIALLCARVEPCVRRPRRRGVAGLPAGSTGSRDYQFHRVPGVPVAHLSLARRHSRKRDRRLAASAAALE